MSQQSTDQTGLSSPHTSQRPSSDLLSAFHEEAVTDQTQLSSSCAGDTLRASGIIEEGVELGPEMIDRLEAGGVLVPLLQGGRPTTTPTPLNALPSSSVMDGMDPAAGVSAHPFLLPPVSGEGMTLQITQRTPGGPENTPVTGSEADSGAEMRPLSPRATASQTTTPSYIDPSGAEQDATRMAIRGRNRGSDSGDDNPFGEAPPNISDSSWSSNERTGVAPFNNDFYAEVRIGSQGATFIEQPTRSSLSQESDFGADSCEEATWGADRGGWRRLPIGEVRVAAETSPSVPDLSPLTDAGVDICTNQEDQSEEDLARGTPLTTATTRKGIDLESTIDSPRFGDPTDAGVDSCANPITSSESVSAIESTLDGTAAAVAPVIPANYPDIGADTDAGAETWVTYHTNPCAEVTDATAGARDLRGSAPGVDRSRFFTPSSGEQPLSALSETGSITECITEESAGQTITSPASDQEERGDRQSPDPSREGLGARRSRTGSSPSTPSYRMEPLLPRETTASESDAMEDEYCSDPAVSDSSRESRLMTQTPESDSGADSHYEQARQIDPCGTGEDSSLSEPGVRGHNHFMNRSYSQGPRGWASRTGGGSGVGVRSWV